MGPDPVQRFCVIFGGVFCHHAGGRDWLCGGCDRTLSPQQRAEYMVFIEGARGELESNRAQGARPDLYYDQQKSCVARISEVVTHTERARIIEEAKRVGWKEGWEEGFAAGFAAGVIESPNYELTEQGRRQNEALKRKGKRVRPY